MAVGMSGDRSAASSFRLLGLGLVLSVAVTCCVIGFAAQQQVVPADQEYEMLSDPVASYVRDRALSSLGNDVSTLAATKSSSSTTSSSSSSGPPKLASTAQLKKLLAVGESLAKRLANIQKQLKKPSALTA